MRGRGQRYSIPSGRCNSISLRSSRGRQAREGTRESSSEEDSEDSDSSSSGSDESEEDETVDLKVSISQKDEVRGFSVPVRKGFSTVIQQLEESYGSRPRLSYYDDDGDKVSILAATDFEYAVRSHKSMTSIEKKSKKMGANKLTFQAEFNFLDLHVKGNSHCLNHLRSASNMYLVACLSIWMSAFER